MAYSHLTLEDRRTIKSMLDAGASVRQIADKLGKHQRAIFYELKRGKRDGQYDPEYAENDYVSTQKSKNRPKAKLYDNPVLAQFVADCILQKRLSPKSIIQLINQDARFQGSVRSTNTIYKAIDDGLIPGVTRESLRSNTVKVFSNGNIILPKWICNEYGYKDGDVFFVEVNQKGVITFTKE